MNGWSRKPGSAATPLPTNFADRDSTSAVDQD
jgi:hypothetical protein